MGVSSNFARQSAAEVAAAASMGLITSVAENGFTRKWRPTQAGLKFLEGGQL